MGVSEICLFGWLTWKEDVDMDGFQVTAADQVFDLGTPECYLKEFFIVIYMCSGQFFNNQPVRPPQNHG